MIQVTIDDMLFIVIVMWLILISVILLNKIKNKERSMKVLNKAKKDRIDLEAITKNIEENYRPANIELTSYEQEQESSAIISYEELISNKNKKINYDDQFENTMDIDVRKVNLSNHPGEEVENNKIEVTLMSYEKEEAFLKALKQLQNDLAR